MGGACGGRAGGACGGRAGGACGGRAGGACGGRALFSEAPPGRAEAASHAPTPVVPSTRDNSGERGQGSLACAPPP
eukprot:6930474-Prymnesium_polylepis.1